MSSIRMSLRSDKSFPHNCNYPTTSIANCDKIDTPVACIDECVVCSEVCQIHDDSICCYQCCK